jgi:hypothetical protein
VSCPSGALPNLGMFVADGCKKLATEGMFPYLTEEEQLRLINVVVETFRLFGATHEVRQRRTTNPSQSQSTPSPGPSNANTTQPVPTSPAAADQPANNVSLTAGGFVGGIDLPDMNKPPHWWDSFHRGNSDRRPPT